MDLINCFRRLWHARQLAVSAAEFPVKTEGTDRMLQGLQQLCAILPQGEAEVWLSNGQINLSLHWNPEVKTQGCKGATMPGNAEEKLRGKSQENACQTGGCIFCSTVGITRYSMPDMTRKIRTFHRKPQNNRAIKGKSHRRDLPFYPMKRLLKIPSSIRFPLIWSSCRSGMG